MGTVYRKTATKPLPAGTKIIVRKGQRFAEWLDAKKKRRTAPVTIGQDGTDRLVVTARTYTAKYRDGSGIVQEVATGCRDESAARSVLGDLERRAELVKAKVLTVDEDRRCRPPGRTDYGPFHGFSDASGRQGNHPKATRRYGKPACVRRQLSLSFSDN